MRIVRDEGMQARVDAGDAAAGTGAAPDVPDAPSDSGLYPCGEGAGYAGGIMSAACDGLRIARAVAAAFSDEG